MLKTLQTAFSNLYIVQGVTGRVYAYGSHQACFDGELCLAEIRQERNHYVGESVSVEKPLYGINPVDLLASLLDGVEF